MVIINRFPGLLARCGSTTTIRSHRIPIRPLEEGLGSRHLDTGSLHKGQSAGFFHLDRDALIPEVDRHDMGNESRQRFDRLV